MLSFFLVVLLALRGLAGDAMAMGTLPAMGASTAAVHHSMPGMDHGDAALAPAAAHAAHHAGDAAAPPTPAHHHSASTADPGSASLHATLKLADRCAAASDSASPTASSCDHSHGAPCAACVVCHSAVSPVSLRLAANDNPPHALPVGGPARFASAQPLQASKPPIS